MEEAQGASISSLSATQQEKEDKALKRYLAYSLIGSVALHAGALSLKIANIWDVASEPDKQPIELVVLDTPEQQVASSEKTQQEATSELAFSGKPRVLTGEEGSGEGKTPGSGGSQSGNGGSGGSGSGLAGSQSGNGSSGGSGSAIAPTAPSGIQVAPSTPQPLVATSPYPPIEQSKPAQTTTAKPVDALRQTPKAKPEEAVATKPVNSPKPVAGEKPDRAVATKPVDSPKPVASEKPDRAGATEPVYSPKPVASEKPDRAGATKPLNSPKPVASEKPDRAGATKPVASPQPLSTQSRLVTSANPSAPKDKPVGAGTGKGPGSSSSDSATNPGSVSGSGTGKRPGSGPGSGTGSGNQPGTGSPTDVATRNANPGTPTEPGNSSGSGRGSGWGRGTCRQCGKPDYPERARIEGREGKVKVSVDVDRNGNVVNVRLQSSSGHADLDEAALRQARRWKFESSESGRQGVIASVDFKIK